MSTSKSKTRTKTAAKAKATKPSTPKKPASAKKAGPPPSVAEAKASGRRRWKDLTLGELRALYVEKVGRPTDSNDRGYLTWKIRAAEKGDIPVGPSRRKLFEGPTTPVTVTLGDTFLEKLDEAGRSDGFKSRLGYVRDLMAKGLEARGRRELAAMVGG